MKLTKEILIDWIDRPPSNSDLDLINYIEQLETKVKNLQNQVNTIKDNNEDLKRRLKVVQRKRDTHKAVRYRLQNKIDDSIEMLETYKRMLSLYSQPVNIFDLQDVIDELKGDSDE